MPAGTIKWPTELSAAEGTELVIKRREHKAKPPTEVEEPIADAALATSPQTGDVTLGQSALANEQSVNEEAEEQDVVEQAGEQGASAQAESTEQDEALDRDGIDAAEAAAAGGSDDSERANNEQGRNDALVNAGSAGGASEESDSF